MESFNIKKQFIFLYFDRQTSRDEEDRSLAHRDYVFIVVVTKIKQGCILRNIVVLLTVVY